MKRKQFRFSCLFFTCFCLFMSGCVTQPPPVRVSDKYKQEDSRKELEKMKKMATLPDINHINQRIRFYEQRLSFWKQVENRFVTEGLSEQRPEKWQECGTSLEKITDGYNLLRKQYLQDKGLAAGAEKVEMDPWDVHRLDLQFFENGCNNVIEAGGKLVGGDLAMPTKEETPETMMVRYASEGKYDQAIEVYRDMMVKSPKQAEVPSIKRMYGMALLRTRHIDAASQVLSQTVDKLDKNNPDSWAQHKLVADLYFATGKIEQAKKEYQKLASFFSSGGALNGWNGIDLWVTDQLALFGPTDKMQGEQGLTIFITVMRSYITFDGKSLPETMTKSVQRLERIFPESKFSKRGRQILWQAEDQLNTWVRSRLYLVEKQVEEKKYDEAKAVLEELLATNLPESLRGEVRKVRDDVILAADIAKGAQDLTDPAAIERQWDEANNLFELRRYDDSIAAFKLLLGTQYASQSKMKIEEASDIAAKMMRRKGAKIFFEAKRATSLERKKELLVESWQELNEISTKYPMSSIIEKVLENMQVIENEIRGIDPSLIQTLGQNKPRGEHPKNALQKEDSASGIVEEEIL